MSNIHSSLVVSYTHLKYIPASVGYCLFAQGFVRTSIQITINSTLSFLLTVFMWSMSSLKLTIMKKIFVIGLLILSWCNLFAQDLITKKDGTDVEAKVLEVTTNEVKYKLYAEPNGVTYTAKKSELLMIRYESGRKDIFTNNSYSDLYTTNREPVEGIVPNMKYKQLKELYNPKEYVSTLGDRYSPAWSGVASFFIPGLGQMICGEVGRGLAFLGGTIGLSIAGGVIIGSTYDDWGDPTDGTAIASLITYAGIIAFDVWAIVDGVRVAKVKNMYNQDLRKLSSVDIDLYPSFNYVKMGNGLQPTAGFTLAMKF